MLIAKKVLQNRIHDIATSLCSKGNGRGAVSTRFRIDDTTFCFLNCQLEGGSGQSQAQKRF
jgi:hypothetical protein